MTGDRAVYAVVSIVALTAVVSGPLVGGVDLTPAGESDIGSVPAGSASITVLEIPDSARFAQGEFGSETVYLEVRAARIHVSGVQGRVQVSYQVSIDRLGYASGTTLVLGPGDTGPRRLVLEREAFDPARITAEQYPAELTIRVYEASGPRTLAEVPITVTVDR